MPTDEDIRWFKQEFGPTIEAAVKGTPFTLDMLVAIACQETGSIWSILRKKGLSTDRIVELCVGDTLDDDRGRKAFPKNKAALLAHPDGDRMFTIGNDALKDMARFIPGFSGAAGNPKKFCHGYGVFQYDIQFFKVDPDYFLERKWTDFNQTLGKALGELTAKMGAAGVKGKTRLTDMEMAQVAIAYNRGSFDPARGLKQGHEAGGRFYGENFFAFLQRSKAVDAGPAAAGGGASAGGNAAGGAFKVATKGGSLMLRSAPRKDPGNVIARLADGEPVSALTGKPDNGFLEIDARSGGGRVRGFASAQFLEPA